MAAKQAMKGNLQCTSKYGHLRISQDICHVQMTDIEGFLTIYGHSDNLLNNNLKYLLEMSKHWIFTKRWTFASLKESGNWRSQSGEIILGGQNSAFLKEKAWRRQNNQAYISF